MPLEPLKIPFGYKLKPEYSKGLVGHWKMNTGGLIIPDLSGNSNHGTRTSMAIPPTALSGWQGQGDAFDGGSDYVDIGTCAQYGLTGAIVATVSMWAKPTGSAWRNLFGGRTGSQSRLYIADYNDFWDIGIAGNGVGTGTTRAINGVWAHIAVVFTGTWATMYINASLSITKSYTVIDMTEALVIGMYAYLGALLQPFNGLIDDVRIYNRALSADEVAHSCFQQEDEWDLGLDDDITIAQGIPIQLLTGQVTY